MYFSAISEKDDSLARLNLKFPLFLPAFSEEESCSIILSMNPALEANIGLFFPSVEARFESDVV